MNSEQLNGKRVAILATDGVEQVELTEPRKALDGAGAKTQVVSPRKGRIKGWQHDHWGDDIDVDLPLDQANASDFDALVLPGGVMNPDHLRQNPRAVQFVRDFFDAGKPVAAICHGPWMLVEAGVAKGRTITSWPSLQTDLRNAGADWVDREVVVDEGLVSSRKPDDIPAFNAKMIEEFAEGRQDEQRPSAHRAHRAHADTLAARAHERTTPPREYEVTPNPVAERANERREVGGGIPNMGPESVPSSGMDRAATDPVGSSDWDESNP